MKAALSKIRREGGFCSANNLAILFIASLFALAQWHLVEHSVDYANSVRQVKLVFAGTPMWRIFQSRVLGPYIVQELSRLIGSYGLAYSLFNISCLTLAGYLAYSVGTFINRWFGGMVSFLLFQCLFALLLDRHWLFVWDSIGVVIFYVFIMIIVRGLPWWWAVVLFAIAILNRESALFIALWLLIDPVCRWGLGRLGCGSRQQINWGPMVAGAACLALGILVVWGLRTTLLIEELGPKSDIPSIYGAHAFFFLLRNVNATISVLYEANHQTYLFVPALIAVMLYLIVRTATAFPSLFLGAALVWLSEIVAIMIVGDMYETRIYVDCIPFLGVATVLLFTRHVAVGDRVDDITAIQ